MNDHPLAAVDDGGDDVEEYSDDFTCCVCLDIIYKPVVLACGHISCFWCVFQAMDTWEESRCPVCRNAYHHFPSICWLLHSVLLKSYPKVYQRRETQVTEMEKSRGDFSPQIENYLGVSDCSVKTPADSQEHGKDCGVSESLEPPPGNICTKITENCSSGSDHVNISDLLCAICKELLCRPVVLNCGHVFCEVCVIDSCNESCRCPVCQSSHPKGFPKVCLVLERFLEQHVSEEYAARRQAIDKLKTREQGTSSAGSSTKVQQGEGGQCSSEPMNDYLHPDLKVHFGVGCDCCGVYPIIGKRYKCKDCLEQIGFDLCEDCYNSSSNLPGRFNQQHKPDHEFEVLEPRPIIFLSPEYFPGDGADNSEDPDSPLDQRDLEADDPEADVVAHGPTNDTAHDQEFIGPMP